ncbi:hypothetical protein [Sporomusa aerivorans]|uniref:hypothetical protein n=1 Tax=Sporomusa aerivorans TaxID=204936 RepID=UPI00352AA188
MERQGNPGIINDTNTFFDTKTEEQYTDGFFGKKHMVALAEAETLLRPEYHNSIMDSLNCGKLSKLIYFLKSGSAYILLYYTYVASVVN